MIHDQYSNSLTSLKRQVSILLLACAALTLTVLICVGSLTSRHDRIVVVPPGLSGPVAIDWGKADVEYMKSFAIFYATLLGTITPRNAEYVADRLSAMTATNSYPLIRKSILSMAKDPSFANSGSATNFVSNQVINEPETGKVFVVGDNQIYSGFGHPKITPVVYEMDISIIEGRPIVSSVVNYPGVDGHTLDWKLNHPDWNKPETRK